MKKIMVFINKELKRFISDKRMIISVIMPGVLIFVLYSLLGNFMYSHENVDKKYQIRISNLPSSFRFIENIANFEVESFELSKQNELKKSVENEKLDLVVVFPSDFETKIQQINSQSNNSPVNISIYYNSSASSSLEAYNIVSKLLTEYENSIVNVWQINGSENEKYDLSTNESSSRKLFTSIVPMFLLAFIINGCISISSEAIAGEKERGTMATLLATPVKRSHIAIGKIMGLSVIGLISGISVFWGLIFSLPQMAKGFTTGIEVEISIYTVKEYVFLMIIIISTVLLLVSIISVISGMAKSIKEANMMSTPLTFLSIIVSLPTMAGGSVESKVYLYFIPLYNSVQCMNDIMNLSIDFMHIFVTVISNIIFTIVFAGILAKLFDNEKVIFG